MTTTWPFTAAAIAAAAAALHRHGKNGDQPNRADLDIAKAGQLLALAAEWLRAGDTTAAAAALELVPDTAWTFARDEVIAASDEPRIAAFANRMSAAGILASPPDAQPTTERLAQVEVLNLIAHAIHTRMRPAH